MDNPETIRRQLPSEITAGTTGRRLRGSIPYNAPAQIVERGRRFTEVIRPGAFARALAGARDVIATFNHDIGRLLGRTTSGTLTLTDGPDALRYEVELPESAADVRELLTRGDLRGSSFTAAPIGRDGDRWKGEHRELVALDLFEVGPVVSPAYPTSGAELRAGGPVLLARFRPLALVGLMTRSLGG